MYNGLHSGSAVVVVPELSRALVEEMAGLVELFGRSGRIRPRGSQVRTRTLTQPATSHGSESPEAQQISVSRVPFERFIDRDLRSQTSPMSGPQP